MIEVIGNIWDFHTQGHWICVPTSGSTNRLGDAVMRHGVTLEARRKFPQLPRMLGNRIRFDNRFQEVNVYPFKDFRVICFPTRWRCYYSADFNLIRMSCWKLTELLDAEDISEVYLPRLGYDTEGINWAEVKPIVATLDDRVKVISLG